MTTKKMLVVTLAKTKAVLGAATRASKGQPTVGELVGAGLVTRLQDSSVMVPAEELEVKEVDYGDDVFRDPRAHIVDASGTVVGPLASVTAIVATNILVTVTVSTPLTLPTVPADKTVLVVIDGGSNHDALKFFGKTALGVADTAVPISGVPPGTHLVLASVDGYGSLLSSGSF